MENNPTMEHNTNSFIDIKSIGMFTASYLLNTITSTPVLQGISAIVMLTTIFYNIIKCIAAVKEYIERKDQKKKNIEP